MAAEGKVPTLAEEYSLPPKEVPVEKPAEEKSATITEASPADEPAADVEQKSETPEVKEPEAEETVPAAEESDAAPEETEEKPEIVVWSRPFASWKWCVAAKGDDAPECEKFAKYYRSLCPSEWAYSLQSSFSHTYPFWSRVAVNVAVSLPSPHVLNPGGYRERLNVGTSNGRMVRSLDPCKLQWRWKDKHAIIPTSLVTGQSYFVPRIRHLPFLFEDYLQISF
ncbi:hypothetical protein TRIUR3_18248 [Triticum urartu]|uniref:Cytochrome c oxidase subunit 6b-1 n=1 Tax=Triticum urartu TaxID=4572 RepID=M7ZG27_TRIUA|nr:hypothetical protein TRIUR3_18248 [Triticum urartu]